MKSSRKFLTGNEIEKIMAVANDSRQAARDRCLIYMCYVHGFRASELCQLTLQDVDIIDCVINVKRLKNGFSTVHPLIQHEIQLLRIWLNERKIWKGSETNWLFLSRNGGTLSRKHFYALLKKYGNLAGLTLIPHPHMLRHSCGYKLADMGVDTRLIQDYLGHRNIRHTVLYTASNAARFSKVWQKGNIY